MDDPPPPRQANIYDYVGNQIDWLNRRWSRMSMTSRRDRDSFIPLDDVPAVQDGFRNEGAAGPHHIVNVNHVASSTLPVSDPAIARPPPVYIQRGHLPPQVLANSGSVSKIAIARRYVQRRLSAPPARMGTWVKGHRTLTIYLTIVILIIVATIITRILMSLPSKVPSFQGGGDWDRK